ncbi:pseudouridine synthase [Pavlovales sp. CCMP2436]|nr:pseudouridine synthase [Pavlovales sp. CCMP2436]
MHRRAHTAMAHRSAALLCVLAAPLRASLRTATHTRLGCKIAAPAGPGGVAHLITTGDWRESAGRTVAALLELDLPVADWLCAFGAVYVDNRRVTDTELLVSGEAYLRVHTKPRRYPAADSTDWLSVVHHETADFVVIEKPRGVPVHASLDNSVETCQARLGHALGVQLLCPHRLDVETRGLLLFAKSPEFLSAFNQLLAARRVRKVYRALCEPSSLASQLAPSPGELRHWMLPGKRSPVRLAPHSARQADPEKSRSAIRSDSSRGGRGGSDSHALDNRDAWRECVSRVHEAREVSVRFSEDETDADTTAHRFYPMLEIELELVTGYTHQLRAQLAYSGWSISGEQIYAANGPSAEDARAAAAKLAATAAPNAAAGNLPGVGPPKLLVPAAKKLFFGLVAHELQFQCPLSAEHFHFKLPAERRWS